MKVTFHKCQHKNTLNVDSLIAFLTRFARCFAYYSLLQELRDIDSEYKQGRLHKGGWCEMHHGKNWGEIL